jgi:hypothetical protein
MIAIGSSGVFVGKLPAARLGDMCAHGGAIILGLPTVMIGEVQGGSVAAGDMNVIMHDLVVADLAAGGDGTSTRKIIDWDKASAYSLAMGGDPVKAPDNADKVNMHEAKPEPPALADPVQVSLATPEPMANVLTKAAEAGTPYCEVCFGPKDDLVSKYADPDLLKSKDPGGTA